MWEIRGRRGYLFEFFFNRSEAPSNVFEVEQSPNCTRDYLEIAAVPPAVRLQADFSIDLSLLFAC